MSSVSSSSDPARLLLPAQSQHALEDFFQNALLRGKEDSKESSSSPLLLLETVGKKFLKDVVVRAVANANNTNASSSPSSEDETNNVDCSGVVRALRLVAKKIEEDIVGRSNADVVLLNCVHRSLHVAKEEISLLATNTRNDGCSSSNNSKEQTKVYKQNVISGIREMITQDIDHARRSVGEFALELCGSDCVVCVLGVRDGLVETFLKNVARKRRVKVIVFETSVSYEENGRAMAEEFARKILNVSSSSSGGGGGGSTSNNKDINNNNNNNSSVEVMIVPESNAFAVMSRAHLAVVSAQLGVFEDGSFYGPPGTANIARACEKFKVPLVALAPSLSLTTAEKPRMNNDDTSSSSSSINSSNSTTTTTKTTTTTSLLSQERNGNPAEVLKHFRATTTTTGGGGSAARDVDAVLHPVREFIDNKNGQQQKGGEDKGGFFVVEAFVTDHGVVAPANLKQLTRELYA